MSTSSYHINKQRDDLQDDWQRVEKTAQKLRDRLVKLNYMPHKCKQCQNTFINEKGLCFAHEWAGKVPKPRHQWKLKRNRDE